jgi:DNA-binding beta-propeller fold protein YncE
VVRVGAQPEGIVYDPATKLVAVAARDPDRLQLLDPQTLTMRRSVPLPGSVRHLQLAARGGPVLVPDESARELLQIALPGGAVRTTRVGKQPHDAAQVGDDIVVGNEFGRSLSVIRAGRVVRTIGGVRQPGGVIGVGTTAVVVDVGRFTVSTYDVTTLRRTAVEPAGKGPTHGVAITGRRVLVADTRGNALLVFGVEPLARSGRLSLPGTPYGLAGDASTNTVWVTLTARNEVVGVDVGSNTPRVIARYRTVRQPNTVAVAPGSHTLWVTGTRDGEVERINR